MIVVIDGHDAGGDWTGGVNDRYGNGMAPETKMLLETELRTLESAWEVYTQAGRHLALAVKARIDPNAGETHRQAVEDADDVLEHFNPGGFVMPDAVDEVMSAIDVLDTRVREISVTGGVMCFRR